MKSLLYSAIGWLLSFFGFIDPYAALRLRAAKLTQAQVDEIIRKCGAPPEMMTLEEGVVIVGGAREPELRACLLDALEASGALDPSQVGNEAYYVPGD